MGLFDKLKNIFIEELVDEEDDGNLKKNNEEIILPKEVKEDVKPVVENVINKEQKSSDLEISDRSLIDTNQNFKFPIIFEEDDFKEEKKRTKSINVLERENTKYEPEIKKDIKPQKKVFKPSPVISPVYGVLDKNYSKDDINSKDGLLNNSGDKIDIDYVIKKAYGSEKEMLETREEKNKQDISLEDSIDLFKEEKEEEIVINSPIDELENDTKTIDELLEDSNDDDFYSLVDSMYKDDDIEEGEK